MEPNVRRELDDLLKIVASWRQSHITWLEIGTDNSCVVQNFAEDIMINVVPYVDRLYKMQHITRSEMEEFVTKIASEVNYIDKLIKMMKEVDDVTEGF